MGESGKKPKYALIADFIRRNIQDKVYREGELIATEKEIAEANDVSIITVKKAFSLLFEEGVLERIPGKKGTFAAVQKQAHLRSKLIGVAIDDISGVFGSQILRGIEDKLWKDGYHAVVCSSDRNFQKVRSYFQSLSDNDVSGIIFAPVIGEKFRKNNVDIIDTFALSNIPYILLDRTLPGISANLVMSDHRMSGRMITEKLLSWGNENILVLYSDNCTSMLDRLDGFRDAMEQRGLVMEDRKIICADDNKLSEPIDEDEYVKLEKMIENAGDFTAVYALNDRLLNMASHIISERNPHGVDNITFAVNDEDYSSLPEGVNGILHTRQSRYEIGCKAAELLLDQIQSPRNFRTQCIFEDELIEPKGCY